MKLRHTSCWHSEPLTSVENVRFWGPPQLGAPPDPSNVEAYPRPDWYFLWVFAALALLPTEIEDYVILIAPW